MTELKSRTRRLSCGLAVLVAVALVGSPAMAAGTDCASARELYSSRLLLADVLANPRARAIIEREAPAVMAPVTGSNGFRFPPGFDRIVTPALVLQWAGQDPAAEKRLDRDLAPLPLTPAIVAARCASYDEVPPKIPAVKRPAMLVFDKITGFRDDVSLAAGAEALRALAGQRGWGIAFSSNGAVFNPRDLARFDVVVWNNVSGDALTLRQRAAFRHWMERGGGFAGIHGAGGDPVYLWDWYADALIGARFKGHPGSPQFQSAKVVVADRASPITRGLGADWMMNEEWYSFHQDPSTRGAHVLATIDEKTYSPVGYRGESLRMGHHPIAWTRCVGTGRSFYTAIGHRPESYAEPHSASLLEHGIEWAMGKSGNGCRGAAAKAHKAR